MIPALLLAFVCVLLVSLALVPAMRELRTGSDDQPLAVHEAYEWERHIDAGAFAATVRQALSMAVETFRTSDPTPGAATRALEPTYEVVGPRHTGPYNMQHPGRPLVIVREEAVAWPARSSVRRPVYVTGDLDVGKRSRIDRVHVDGNVRLGDECRVERWLHAAGEIDVGSGSVVDGSIGAEGTLAVGPGCTFERLEAKEVRFGDAWHWPADAVVPRSAPLDARPLFRLHGRASDLGPGSSVDANLLIPADHAWVGDMVVTGNLRLGRGAVISGNVKVVGSVVLDAGSRINGHLFSEKGIELRRGAVVTGTVATEGRLRLGTEAEIGRPEAPATATGKVVVVDQGARVFGAVVAEEMGRVVTRTSVRRCA